MRFANCLTCCQNIGDSYAPIEKSCSKHRQSFNLDIRFINKSFFYLFENLQLLCKIKWLFPINQLDKF